MKYEMEKYHLQTERLIYQLTTDDVALTGMHLFRITRNFMLAVRKNQVIFNIFIIVV